MFQPQKAQKALQILVLGAGKMKVSMSMSSELLPCSNRIKTHKALQILVLGVGNMKVLMQIRHFQDNF